MQSILIFSYTKPYNRQGLDLVQLLRRERGAATLVQLDGTSDPENGVYGIKGIKPHGFLSSVHVLYNLLRMVLSVRQLRPSLVVCVGQPAIILGTIYARFLKSRSIYYALEYGALDRRTANWLCSYFYGIVNVEANRQHLLDETLGCKLPSFVLPNVPHLQQSGFVGKLRSYLKEKHQIAEDAKLIIYAGSYQKYGCFDEVMAASHLLPANHIIVFMGFGFPEERLEPDNKSVVFVPPRPHGEFYEWLVDADLALLPYETEGDLNVKYCSPQKLFDCFLVGVPFVASERPIIEGVLQECPAAGLMVDFRVPTMIAKGVVEQLQQSKSEAGEKMRWLYRVRYNYEAYAGELRSFLFTDF